MEERNPDLHEEEDIRMEDSSEYHCRDVSDDGEYKSKILYTRWDLYKRDKAELIKR